VVCCELASASDKCHRVMKQWMLDVVQKAVRVGEWHPNGKTN